LAVSIKQAVEISGVNGLFIRYEHIDP